MSEIESAVNSALNLSFWSTNIYRTAQLIHGRQDMRDSDPPVQPDIITYSTIVKAHGWSCCILAWSPTAPLSRDTA